MLKRLFNLSQTTCRACLFRPARTLPFASIAVTAAQVNGISNMSGNNLTPVTKTEDEWRAQLSPEQVSRIP